MENSGFDETKLPLLGSLDDGETFEYILWSIHSDYIEIAILNWLVKRSKLHKNEIVHLYIPQFLCDQYRLRKNVSGIVTSMSPYHEMKGEIYRIGIEQMEQEYSLKDFTFQLPVAGNTVSLLIQLIKDSMLLKQGIEVYIKHIIPYFSRIVDYTNKEYIEIKKHFLLDVEKHIKSNVGKLKEIHQTLQNKLTKANEIPIYIDLEELREICESEISKSLFQIVFTKNDSLVERNYGFFINIDAIKNLENRLYSNYNQVVFLYLKSLEFLSSQA